MASHLGLKHLFLGATTLTAVFAVPAWAASPTGFFVVIDPYKSSGQTLLTAAASGLPYSSVFGPFSGLCGSSPADDTCKGGITGVFLAISWTDYQSRADVQNVNTTYLFEDAASPNGTVSYVGPVQKALYQIEQIEALIGHPLQIAIGLDAGAYASYTALDVYQASHGLSFVTPILGNVGPDYSCAFKMSDDGETISGNGGTFSSGSIFPTQCTLSQTVGNKTPECTPEPNIWASSSSSYVENGWYVTAYTNAVKDLAYQVTNSRTSNGQAYVGHDIDLLKIGGIARGDLEVGLAGNPADLMPAYTCGYAGATDAEAVWTDQSNAGTNHYDTGAMEYTFAQIFSNLSTLVATTAGGTITNFGVDTYATHDFPPVGPRHCTFPTQCTYTAASDPSIGTLTTGEEDYLVKSIISNGGGAGTVNRANILVQTQDLQTGKPSQGELNYSTDAIPCAMQADYGTGVGYQTITGFTFTAAGDNQVYLAALSNAGTYGAQYIELQAAQITNFGTNTGGGAVGSNLYELSDSLYSITQMMETNVTNSLNGSQTCPGTFSTF